MIALLALLITAADPLAEPFATLTLTADELRGCTTRRCEFARVDADFAAYRALTDAKAKQRARDDLARKYRALFDETARGPAKKGADPLRNAVPIVDAWTIAASCRIAEVTFDYATKLHGEEAVLEYDAALHDVDKALLFARKKNVDTPYVERCQRLRTMAMTARADAIKSRP
jgi:hypothetical protein